MGATIWTYFTDYDEQPDRALHRLRDEIFDAGQYRRPWEFPDFFVGVRDLPNVRLKTRLTLWVLESLYTTIELFRWAAWGFRSPSSIEEAVAWAEEDGTHSILDIERTGMYRGFGVAIPLSELRLREFFGTTEPGRDAAEEAAHEISCSLARWEAVYFPVYEDGKPRHLVFIGVSGD
ncbi:hypothetical protein [Longimicrobium sp.]|jgi:hypothetical protein|uniref:hypothetical protein n=1 Tax=Longimicrobium sp. TaxID=2029185 RepID=UPI002EDA01A5